MSLLGRHFAAGLDPTKLASQLGMVCDPWQAELLRSNAPRLHVNCSRQSGKSTTASIAALARAMYRPSSLVLIVSPTMRQSQELFGQVKSRYRSLGKPVESEVENQLSLTLENGSRVISVPGSESGIRGFTVDLLVIDEAARVDDAVWASLSPMTAVSKGHVIAMSTPAGRRGWWFEASNSRKWKHFRVPASACPRIDTDFLAEEREALGDLAFRQEYECEFVDAAGAAFSGEDIDAFVAGSGPERPDVDEAEELDPSTREVRRVVGAHERMLAGRRDSVRRRRAAEVGRCQHRWRRSPAGDYCVLCAVRREEISA